MKNSAKRRREARRNLPHVGSAPEGSPRESELVWNSKKKHEPGGVRHNNLRKGSIFDKVFVCAKLLALADNLHHYYSSIDIQQLIEHIRTVFF